VFDHGKSLLWFSFWNHVSGCIDSHELVTIGVNNAVSAELGACLGVHLGPGAPCLPGQFQVAEVPVEPPERALGAADCVVRARVQQRLESINVPVVLPNPHVQLAQVCKVFRHVLILQYLTTANRVHLCRNV